MGRLLEENIEGILDKRLRSRLKSDDLFLTF